MNSKIIAVLCLFLAVSFAAEQADTEDYDRQMEDYAPSNDETQSDEKPVKAKKTVVEDLGSETSALIQQDSGDSDADKHKGFCHWGIGAWYKPGFQIRCGCMRCTCKVGGFWNCGFHFGYCPYFYCGNNIYNPATQICCCGKIHDKKRHYSCCGYFFYDTRVSQCCNYYSVKPRKARCPRHQV